MWHLWWTKWHCGRFSLSISVSLAKNSTDCSTFIIVIRGWYDRPVVASIIIGSVRLYPKQEEREKIVGYAPLTEKNQRKRGNT
jgi:hypothetical protein